MNGHLKLRSKPSILYIGIFYVQYPGELIPIRPMRRSIPDIRPGSRSASQQIAAVLSTAAEAAGRTGIFMRRDKTHVNP